MSYRECRTSERDIGMKYYLTDTDGTGGRLKLFPEDFVVNEISKGPPAADDGGFSIATVTSCNWETNRLVRIMSRSLGISRERIGFAGTKDKRAVTTQLMSFGCPPERLGELDLKDVSVSGAYRARRGIRIGDLIGNRFEITVRECDSADAGRIREMEGTVADTGGFPNYFGVQRFGAARPITHIVGERIVRGDMEGAVMTYLSHPSAFEEEDVRNARVILSEDIGEAIGIMPRTMSFERTMAEHLLRRPDDFAGALSLLPPNLQMMFVHAYQSYLFNLMLSRRMESGMPLNEPVVGDTVIPLDNDGTPMHERPVTATRKNIDLVARQVRGGRAHVAITLFGSESRFAEGEMGEIERSVVASESLTNEDFIVPALRNCSSKGSRREVLCPVEGLGYSLRDDGYTMRFSLPKGNYATCLMREFMKSDMERY